MDGRLVTKLLELVRGTGDDARSEVALEGARDLVRVEDVPVLAAAWPTLDTWPQRRALVLLLQDHLSAASRPLMRQFLLHLPASFNNSEAYQLARAIAVCHLESDLGRFTHYFSDDATLEKAVGRVRHEAAAGLPERS